LQEPLNPLPPYLLLQAHMSMLSMNGYVMLGDDLLVTGYDDASM
jgi:hypothetical protein